MNDPDRLRVGDKSAEEVNHALALAFEACWNSHDMRAFGQMLTVDADWVAVGGSHWKGREEIERERAARHTTQFEESVWIHEKSMHLADDQEQWPLANSGRPQYEQEVTRAEGPPNSAMN